MSSDDGGQLKIDPLFVGLTRPPMFLGVSYLFVVVNGFLTCLYFINTSDFRVIFLTVAIHLMGYLICFKEPLFIEIYMIRAQKCTRCRNKMFHGANSYDVY